MGLSLDQRRARDCAERFRDVEHCRRYAGATWVGTIRAVSGGLAADLASRPADAAADAILAGHRRHRAAAGPARTPASRSLRSGGPRPAVSAAIRSKDHGRRAHLQPAAKSAVLQRPARLLARD